MVQTATIRTVASPRPDEAAQPCDAHPTRVRLVRRLRQRLAAMVVGILIPAGLVLGLSAAPASAHTTGDGAPYHKVWPTECGGIPALGTGRVEADFPLDVRGYSTNWELVYWKPYLQRYTSSGWQTVDTSAPWYNVYANKYGIYSGSYRNAYYQWNAPYSGYYRVINWIYWPSTGLTHGEYSDWCQIP